MAEQDFSQWEKVLHMKHRLSLAETLLMLTGFIYINFMLMYSYIPLFYNKTIVVIMLLYYNHVCV